MKNTDKLHAMRHSLAHIMAGAIQRMYPDAKFGVGPVVEHGFYYDVDFGDIKVTPEDLPKIEAEMAKIIKEDYEFEQYDLSIDEAIVWAKEHNQDYKASLLNDLKTKGTTAVSDIDEDTIEVGADSASFYRDGDFEDLCRGPHVASTGKVGVFKLMSLAGAYWRGDESNPQMTRIYGIAFETQDELDQHLENLEKAKENDHRKVGAELGLFTNSELVGAGLPLYTPRGTVLRDLLGRYSQQLREEVGFERVWTPHITKSDLYKTSGHWDKFGDELFLVKSQESSDEFVLKPMNCPHHTQIYAAEPRSYRDLPIKYMEYATDYRDEKSGELHGLSRVRAFTQDDSHAFCRLDQIADVASELIVAAQKLYSVLGMELEIRLSFRGEGDGYLGEDELWAKAEALLEQVAKDHKLDANIDVGEAAFYGPKIDFITRDVMGREWQVATVQVDFVQPTRFALSYKDENDTDQTPVMIHCALLGSIERLMAALIEHTGGQFPFWLAPEQIRILTINDQVLDYVEKITSELDQSPLMKPLKFNEIRYTLDDRNESLGKKIREAETQKIPMMFIVGPKDVEASEVSIRTRDGEVKVGLGELQAFIQKQ